MADATAAPTQYGSELDFNDEFYNKSKAGHGVSTQMTKSEMQLSLQATTASIALGDKLQSVYDSIGYTEEAAKQAIKLAEQAFASGHVFQNLRLEGCLQRIKTRNSAFSLEHLLKGLVAACKNVDHPDHDQGRKAELEKLNNNLQQAIEILKEKDPEVATIRARIMAEKKLTPSTTQKILKPVKARMSAAYFQDLLESVQLKPSEFKDKKRREDFLDAIVSGIVYFAMEDEKAKNDILQKPFFYE